MDIESDTLEERRHPWSLRYIRLKAVVLLIRFFGLLSPLSEEKRPPLPPTFQRRLVRVASRQKGRSIKAHIYRSSSTSALNAPLPVHITWHGSGFVLPRFATDYAYVDHHLKQLGPDCILVDADYRKAPEHPFPAAVHDAIDVVNYILSQPHIYDVDRITLGGFSAGAGLALVVGAHFGPQRIAGVAALYPVVDFTVKPNDYPLQTKQHDSGVILPGWLTDYFIDAYVVRQEDKSHPLCSVKFADPASFPRLLIASGKADTLHTEAQELVSHLNDAGRTDARFISIDNEGHGFDKRPKCPESHQRTETLYHQLTEFIRLCWSATSAQ
ncbi:uncharacterized protein SPSC_04167 [Sporisorium scitamineum]|uniref:Alpha/beta hydrolase fold-3 domain-containing protein n=1 Tax=Sporisorium scitamineum TaxID=49012 RepID=A0A0F7RVH8_9BASI|nr:uncharacterized protein SPSC_04167 [Sporisorium scitamineum]CDR98787.1 hypothetical protein [Sporisorium scitamineum]